MHSPFIVYYTDEKEIYGIRATIFNRLGSVVLRLLHGVCHHWRRGQAAPATPEDSQPDGHDEDGCEHVRHLGHHEDDEAEEGQAEIVRCRVPEGREFRRLARLPAVGFEF